MVDAAGSGHKRLHEGKEYDYVFDVDIKDGAPPLKLPYNVNGGFIAWTAGKCRPLIFGQKILMALRRDFSSATSYHPPMSTKLSSSSRKIQLVSILAVVATMNTLIRSRASLGSLLRSRNVAEHATGASRYQSSANSVSMGPASSYVDPYTGTSRYSGATHSATAPTSAPPFQPVVIISHFSIVFVTDVYRMFRWISFYSSRPTSQRCRPNYSNSTMTFATKS